MYAYKHRGLFSAPNSQDHTPIEKVVIMVAMPEEAQPILNLSAFNFHKANLGLSPQLHLEAYRGRFKNKEITLILNGLDPELGIAQVGTINAALCTHEVIQKVKPDTILSVGTAGYCKPTGAIIGDIFISEKQFMFHDRRIPLAQYEDYGKGFLPCLEAPAMVSYLHLKKGIMSTGNSLSTSPEDKKLLTESNAVAKDMEVAAIADVAHRYGVRVMGVKAITNIAGESPAGEFQRNFDIATRNLANKLPHILTYLLGSTPAQLQHPVRAVKTPLYARM